MSCESVRKIIETGNITIETYRSLHQSIGCRDITITKQQCHGKSFSLLNLQEYLGIIST